MINWKKTALATSLLSLPFFLGTSLTLPLTAQASGLDSFQDKVNQIAEKHNVEAPNVKNLGGKNQVKNDEEETGDVNPIKALPKIKKMVSIPTNAIHVVQAEDGYTMYIIDNGHFALVGNLVDIWNQKVLTTPDEIQEAISKIDLKRIGFKVENLNHITLGKGKEVVTVFVDPRCGYCHQLMSEINADPMFLKSYTFHFIITPVLGKPSQILSKKLLCTTETDQKAKFDALRGGSRAIDALPMDSDGVCENEDQLNKTTLIAKAIGLQGVPMVIAPDGRFSRGKPESLKDFLVPKKEKTE